MLGIQSLEDEADSHRRNREAEESCVRRQVWGSNENPPESTGDDEMRQTFLGDYNVTQVLPQPQAQETTSPSLLPTLLLGAGLLAAGAGLPAAAYIATQNKAQPAAQSPTQPSTTTINRSGLDEDTTIQLTLPEWNE